VAIIDRKWPMTSYCFKLWI